MKPRAYKLERGITLIELLITLIIIAVLFYIAIPQYQEFVRRGHRAEAAAGLLVAAAQMQQAFTINNPSTYAGVVPNVGAVPNNQFPRLTMHQIRVAAANANSFTLQAQPNAGFNDPRCGTLIITETGARGLEGDHTGTVADCWGGR